MAREVKIVTWCDYHLDQDNVQVEAAEYRVAFDGEPLVIDLCLACARDYMQPLVALLERLGRKDETTLLPGDQRVSQAKHKPPSAMDVQCPYCFKTLKGRSSLNGHMTRKHDTSLAEYEASQGLAEHACEQCAKQGKAAGFATAQALALHKSRVHPVKAVKQRKKAS